MPAMHVESCQRTLVALGLLGELGKVDRVFAAGHLFVGSAGECFVARQSGDSVSECKDEESNNKNNQKATVSAWIPITSTEKGRRRKRKGGEGGESKARIRRILGGGSHMAVASHHPLSQSGARRHHHPSGRWTRSGQIGGYGALGRWPSRPMRACTGRRHRSVVLSFTACDAVAFPPSVPWTRINTGRENSR